MLTRSNTARPRSSSGYCSAKSEAPQSQIVSLAQALSNAQLELKTQSTRLKDLEQMLAQERQAREIAEERASRWEKESTGWARDTDGIITTEIGQITTPLVNGVISGSEHPHPSPPNDPLKELSRTSTVDESTSRLQQRFDLMLAEMSEMKQQMEKYRVRAEAAEAQSAEDRRSLADMVEKIRHDDAERVAGEPKKQQFIADTGISRYDGTNENGAAVRPNEKGRAKFPNGEALRPKDEPTDHDESNHMTMTKALPRQDVLAQSSPYVTMMGVVLLGVGMMAWINGWQQKVER